MVEGKKMSKGAKIGIGVAVLVAVAGLVALVIWLLTRKGETSNDPPGPGPNPRPDDPTPEPAPRNPDPDPMDATPQYIKGRYHIVKSGDSDALMCQKAGFATGQVYQARKALRDHRLNAWIPQKGNEGAKQLNLFQGWAPMVGHEDHSWAWKTEKVAWGNKKWPIVYIPRDDEVQL